MKRGACLVIAVLAVSAGCGASGDGRLSKNEYEAKLRTAFTAASDHLRAQSRIAGSPTLVRSIAASYSEIASSLRGVRPPSDAEALNDRLVAGATAQAAVLNGLAAKIAGQPKAARERILAEFDADRIEGQRQFDAAVEALTARGYEFRPSAGT